MSILHSHFPPPHLDRNWPSATGSRQPKNHEHEAFARSCVDGIAIFLRMYAIRVGRMDPRWNREHPRRRERYCHSGESRIICHDGPMSSADWAPVQGRSGLGGCLRGYFRRR
eukprot:10964783-Alexandrium_andersonii.AAC.1